MFVLDKQYSKLWKLTESYLKKGVRKDFVLHTKEVIKAMNLILKNQKNKKINTKLLMTSAIVHDVGWAKVPKEIQKSKNRDKQIEGMKLHIKYAPEIIPKILSQLDYTKKEIKQVCDIVIAHKFCKPRNVEKRLLIDADNLSECFQTQFNDDVKSYGCSPLQNYNYRIKNTYYTQIATKIFKKEMKQRYKEIVKK
jgi:hypothetical protein